MKVCVMGLWHLGCVTAACLSNLGVTVTGYVSDNEVINLLNKGDPPLYEPGLKELIVDGIEKHLLEFTTDLEDALKGVDYIWICYDTPVDADDNADIDFVFNEIKKIKGYVNNDLRIVISSQMPVGSTGRCEKEFSDLPFGIDFAYSPENLRLGHAIEIFEKPDRVVVGTRNIEKRVEFEQLFNTITDQIIWMTTESAEMTKHAINAFLATSVTFANEIACICECVGADALEVSEGLKSESRIGRKAYVGPGSAFAGGTLARDIVFLNKLAEEDHIQTAVLSGVKESNDYHKGWAKRKLKEVFGSLDGKMITVLGLTYKPGTNTLRRSLAIELCDWIYNEGGRIIAFDPLIKELPIELKCKITIADSLEHAIINGDALIVATEWAEFRETVKNDLLINNGKSVVIDANGFLRKQLNTVGISYYSVGKGVHTC